MENYSNSSYTDSLNSTPRSRDIDCWNQSLDEQPKKVKLMCSYGGKIQPRQHDNRLSYIGGDTKILTVERSIKFGALIDKLSSFCGSKSKVWFKYQLPGEDLEALISVTNDDDLENMMLEYDRSPKPARLRLFLWFLEDLNSVEETGFGKGWQSDSAVEVQALSQSVIQIQLNELRRTQISGQEQVVHQQNSSGHEGMVPVQQGMPVCWQGESQMIAGGYQVTASGAGIEQPQQVYINQAPGGVSQASTNYGHMTQLDGQGHTQMQAYYGTQRIIPEAYREQQVYSSGPGLVAQVSQQPRMTLYDEGISSHQLTERGGYVVAYDVNGRQLYYSVTAAGGGVAHNYEVLPTAAAHPVTRFTAVNLEGNATADYSKC